MDWGANKMRTNLLQAIEFPEKMNIIEIETDYKTLKNILKDSNIFFYFKSKKIYFFGHPIEANKLLENTGYSNRILDSICIDADCIQQHWDILRVLFYKAIEHFLRKKQLYFHPRKRNVFYMIKTDCFKGIHLIRENNAQGYYIHEGFEFKLHLINKNVFLCLTPLIVLTTDKKSKIISDKEDSGLYTQEGFKRWNKVTRDLLNTWAVFLGNEKRITVPIPNENDLIFETEFSKAGGGTATKNVKQIKKIKKIRQVSLDEYR